jgi:hypothetical protein
MFPIAKFFAGAWIRRAGIVLAGVLLVTSAGAQERRGKLRISNAGFTITALPLLEAHEKGTCNGNRHIKEIKVNN